MNIAIPYPASFNHSTHFVANGVGQDSLALKEVILGLVKYFSEPAIAQYPPPPKKNLAAIELLRSWRECGDTEEQRETLDFLKKALDEDRPSNRKLFP